MLVGVEALRLGPDKTFLAQQLPDLAARFAGDDRQVQVLALQQLLGGVAVHFDLDQRIGLGEARQDARQEAHDIVVGRADLDHADHVRLTQGVEHFTVQLEDPPGVAEQHLALGGQLYLAAVALEQLALQHVLFKTLHLHADRRLRAVDQLASTGETALVGNGDERAQDFGINAGVGAQLINLRDVLHKKHSLD